MTRSQMLRKLRDLGACEEGYRWVRLTTATSFAELLPLFTRADWMMWLYVRVQPDNRAGRVSLALDCAETADDELRKAYAAAAADAGGPMTAPDPAASPWGRR